MAGETTTKQSISADLATRLIMAAAEKAGEMGVPMAIDVCDESGVRKAFLRMDGAALLAVDVAHNKAKTAAGFGMPTHAWHDFIKDDPPLAAGALNIEDLIIFGGGYPVTVGGAIVGGLGVSGGHYSQDMECAEAALKILG